MNRKDFINEKLNKDFYDVLPGTVCDTMDYLIQSYGDRDWFIHAWNEYREHVLESTIISMQLPGCIFNKYLEQDELKHSDVFDEFTSDEIMYRLGDYIEHIGVGADDNPPGRGSGRYPKGSGKNPYQHETIGDFYTYVQGLERKGLSEVEIAEGLGISTTRLRALYTIDKNNLRREKISYAKKAQAEGKSNIQIGKELGEKYNLDKSPIGESTVRSLLNGDAEARMNISMQTAENLKKILEEKGTLDVGIGVERELGISRNKLDVALEILQAEGYNLYNGRVAQANNKGQFTTVKILTKPEYEHKDIYDWESIGHLNEYTSPDDGDHIFKFRYPESMDSKRLQVRFAEDGGTAKDGLVEIRRNVKDLSLGESNYAQVRILVDDKYYIKGMAVYGNDEDFPEGVDIIFNSNKPKSKGKLGALKEADPSDIRDGNPFGSSIKEGVDYPGAFKHGGQSYYLGDDGKYHLSLINKRADEGDWEQWSKELPSQMLGKQPQKTIERQLNLAKMTKEEEFEQILEVTNPTIKREMLNEFADKCDRAAIDLKAAPFPGQKYQVILPLETIKDGECYAPNYTDGSELALIRYPHGGTFEIPIVKVNNRNKEGKEYISPSALDAVGINAHTASILSGADFDGDTVMVIPLQPDKFKIQSKDPLKGLEGFDPKLDYGPDPTQSYKDKNGIDHYVRNGIEYPIISESYKQIQMGVVSNLITDMTLAGASEDELAAAVRHSMVIIDAEKHKLDYKSSEIDNNIKTLHKKYQGHIDPESGRERQGASTILSRAKNPKDVLERKPGAYIANDTGNVLTLIDDKKKLYLDEKTGVVYGQKDKHTEYIDPKTGKKLYRNTNVVYRNVEYRDSNGKKQTARIYEQNGELYYKEKETGKLKKVSNEKILPPKPAMQKSTKMAEAEDAYSLSSGKPQEILYADYANKMKSLANSARKEAYFIEDTTYSPASAKTYANEVKDLQYQLNEALKNTPKERQAQMIAASQLKAKIQEDPHMSEEEKTKLGTRLLNTARAKVGAERKEIKISDKQWEAIQAGAIRPTKLKEIFRFADKTRVRQLATPYKNKNELSSSQIGRLKTLSKRGFTTDEIAKLFGVSRTTITKYLLGKE